MIVNEDKDEIVIIVLNEPANVPRTRNIPVDLIIATGLAIGGGGGGGSMELG